MAKALLYRTAEQWLSGERMGQYKGPEFYHSDG
jgi:hypothetical protein